MTTKDINISLKNTIAKSGTSTILYNLITNNAKIKTISNEHKNIVNLLNDILSGSKKESALIANDSMKIIDDFITKINNAVPSGECYILAREEVNKSFSWTHLTYVLENEEANKETIATISIKGINDEVDDKLISSFWHKEIMSGIARGNSYFIVNIEDEFILDSCGKFAIKTKSFKDQINFIADLCCDGMSQKFRCTLSKENLLKLYNENNVDDLLDVLIQDLDGIQRWFKIKVIYTKNSSGNKTFAYIIFSDIDVKYRAFEDIKYNATHDMLTGVLNRHTFAQTVTQEFNKLNNNYWNALIFIDIDDFKKVNDVLGHAVGDRVLRGVAKGIKKSFKSGSIIGRVGGDEFMVLFSAPTLYTLYTRVGLLNSNIKEVSKIDSISVSIGVVTFTTGMESNFDKLYHLSDKAMYDSKNSGKSGYCIMDEYENNYLSDVVPKIENTRFLQMLKLSINDFIFCTASEEGITIDYVTPKVFRNILNGKKINKIEELKKILSEKDFQKLTDAINNSSKFKETIKIALNINGRAYKVVVLNSNCKIMIGIASH